MTDKNGNTSGIDPLRTFDLDRQEWQEIIDSVVTEGRQSWEDYASTLVAAIELGYLDAHLQMLGKFLRERYLHLKGGAPAPAYYARGDRAVGTVPVAGVAAAESKFTPMILPPGVTPIREIGPNNYIGRGNFAARGHVFRNADFIGYHFRSKAFDGSIIRIDKINPKNFLCTIVECTSKPAYVGRGANFTIEKQYHLYNIPKN